MDLNEVEKEAAIALIEEEATLFVEEVPEVVTTGVKIYREDLTPSFNQGNSVVSFEKLMLLYENKVFPKWVGTPQVAMIVGSWANALHIDPVLVVDMMYLMQGKVNLMYNAYVYAITKAGGEIETVRDWDAVYETDNPKDFYLKGNLVLRKQYESFDAKGNGVGEMYDLPYFMGYATTIRSKRPDQSFSNYTTFTSIELATLGLFKSGGMWDKNPKVMAWAKAITLVGRRYFSDSLIG